MLPQIVFGGCFKITKVTKDVAVLGFIDNLFAGCLASLVSRQAVLVLETFATILAPKLLLVNVQMVLIFPLRF